MRRMLWSFMVALGLAGCATVATPTPSAGTPPPLQVSCDQTLAQATCDEAVTRSVAAVQPSGWTPTRIWIGTGQFCPWQSCLFDPDQNVPYPDPPSGGQWVANAEIAFAQTDEHAGLNVASVGTALVPVLIGYRTPLLTWCSGFCPTSSSTDGDYRLELSVPHLAWKVGDPISGWADLGLTGSLPTTAWGAGQLIAFAYSEVGGTREFGPMSLLDCGPFPLDPATPLGVALNKQGSVTASGADADFQRSFMAGSDIHLPVGTWDITAIADFNEGADCAGTRHTIKTSLRITVTE